MSMLAWRYCGRFVSMAQDAYPDSGLSWIDEEEARRRYQDRSVELALIPPVDELTGIIPWYITVTTAEHPSFTVTYQQPPGVPSAKAWWKNLGDGRLFGDEAELWEYPTTGPRRLRSTREPPQVLCRCYAGSGSRVRAA